MNIFKKVNEYMADTPPGNEEVTFPAFRYEDMDAEDQEELKGWEDSGAYEYMKTVGKTTFYISIEPKSVR